MAVPQKVYFPSFALRICGELYVPSERATDRGGAAVVISHPMTGVKEQTAADHARLLAKAGFYALTFDAGYQGESTGMPRGLEDPHQRVEDVKAAISYMTTLKDKVDPDKIGVLGICASGGYTSYAAQSDVRIRALATVSAACVGRMTRNGGLHKDNHETPEIVEGTLKVAAQWRNEEAAKAHGEAPQMFNARNIPEDADSFFKDAGAYYGSSRGHHERSDQRVPPVSYDLMMAYDSFAFQHLISPRALLMIAGSNAQTLHYSEWSVDAAREPKELLVIENRNHFDLYDDLEESGPKLVAFFAQYLVST